MALMLGLGFFLFAGLVVLAAAAVYWIVVPIAAQVLSSVLQGIAAVSAAVAALAAIVVALAVMMLLQTPPLLAPFGPLARLIWLGFVAWLGQSAP
jgi:hypothetical protein